MDIPFVHVKEEWAYEFRLTRILRRLRRSKLDKNTAQILIVPHFDLCCFDYPISVKLFFYCCDPFWGYLDFERRVRGIATHSSRFVSWRCAEPILNPIFYRTRSYLSVDYPEWCRLKTRFPLLVRTVPIFAYCRNWAFDGRSRMLFSRLQRASALLVLRCSFSRLLPQNYSELASFMIAFSLRYHYWLQYIHPPYLCLTSWISKKSLPPTKQSGRHLHDLKNVKGSGLVGGYVFFSCFPVASLRLRPWKSISLSHRWEHLYHRSWGSASRWHACYHCYLLSF